MPSAAALERRDDVADLAQRELDLAGAPQAGGETVADLRQIRFEIERRAEGIRGGVGASCDLVHESREDVRRRIGRIAGERERRFTCGILESIRLQVTDRGQDALGGRRRGRCRSD